MTLHDQNSAATLPLLIFFVGGATSIFCGLITGEAASGVVASPFVGYGLIEISLTLPTWVRDKIMPYLRLRSDVAKENEELTEKYRRGEERAAETIRPRESKELHNLYWERIEGKETDNVFFYENKKG